MNLGFKTYIFELSININTWSRWVAPPSHTTYCNEWHSGCVFRIKCWHKYWWNSCFSLEPTYIVSWTCFLCWWGKDRPSCGRLGDTQGSAASGALNQPYTRGSGTFIMPGLLFVLALSQLLKQPPGSRCFQLNTQPPALFWPPDSHWSREQK